MRRSILLCVLCLLLSYCARPAHDPDDETSDPGLETFLIIPQDFTKPPQIAIRLGKAAVSHATLPLRLKGQDVIIARSHLDRQLVLFVAITANTRHGSMPELLTHDIPLVRFTQIGNQILLMADAVGQMTQQHNNVPLILASFPILAETPQAIRFDFHAGALQDLYVTRHLANESKATDLMSLMAQPGQTRPTSAFFRTITAGDDWVSLEQVVSTPSAAVGGVVRFTFWQADASTMPPLLDDPDDHLGYFNTTINQVDQPAPTHIVRRWDTHKPLTFYLSANTPSIYRDAVRAGVLAWNTALEEDWLQVADAPKGVTPGDPRYPLIQWIEGDTATARGMTQSHPRTGETFIGLVTFMAGWATIADWVTPALLDDDDATVKLVGFRPHRLCDYQAHPGFPDWLGLDDWTKLGAAGNLALRRAQVRAVIMHEVGHVLGLRHNFAGNLATELTRQEVRSALEPLLRGEDVVDTRLPSSSIMDYLPLHHDALMNRPGTYDAAAVRHAYCEDHPYPDRQALPRFCTDEGTQSIADCQARDGGNDPIEWWAHEVDQGIADYNDWVIANIIVPPDQLETFAPNLRRRAIIVNYRMQQGIQNLQRYGPNNTWPLGGAYPLERRTKAQAALQALRQPKVAGRPFIVRNTLADRMAALEAQAQGSDETARWARQILANLAIELKRTTK